jgi:regulator of extracellular matrix RemA (YlzA/DUF370 family)
MQDTINIGFGAYLHTCYVLSFLPVTTKPVKRLIDEAKAERRLVDMTCGKRAKTAILLSTGQVYLSWLSPAALKNRVVGQSAEQE